MLRAGQGFFYLIFVILLFLLVEDGGWVLTLVHRGAIT
jgi:hypothetical protein